MWEWSELKAEGKDKKNEAEVDDNNEEQGDEDIEEEEENKEVKNQVCKTIQVLIHIESYEIKYQIAQLTHPHDICIIS